MTNQLLSSDNTWMMKFVVPWFPVPFAAILLLGPAGLATLGIQVAFDTTTPMRLVMGAIFAGTTYGLFRFGRHLMRIELTNHALIISDFSHENAIPLAAVSHIEETRWLHLHPITIYFNSPTPVGGSVTFIPDMTNQWFTFTSHPVISQIRQAVAVATGRQLDAPAA